MLRSAPYLIVIDHVYRICEEIGGRNERTRALIAGAPTLFPFSVIKYLTPLISVVD